MNICVFIDRIPSGGGGGAERVVLEEARALKARGHRVTIITTTRERGRGITEGTEGGVPVFFIHSDYHERWRAWRSLYNPSPIREVRHLLQALKPDIVHAHNVHYHLSYYALVVAKELGCRTVLTVHDVMLFHYGKLNTLLSPNDLSIPTMVNYRVSPLWQLLQFRFRYNPFRNAVIRFILNKYVDRIIAVSTALKDALEQNGIANVVVVHNSIDASAWEEPAEKVEIFKEKHHLGKQVVLFGGRLSTVKGAHQLITALPLIAKKVPAVQLLVVGEKDAYAEKMLTLAQTLGVADTVVFTGWLSGEELRQAYRAAAVITVPSLCFDSFPTMILEAMASHRAIVATCLGGAREAVVDGETGYIINPYDTVNFADRLADLLIDDTKRVAFGERGCGRAQNLFSLDRHSASLEKYYRG